MGIGVNVAGGQLRPARAIAETTKTTTNVFTGGGEQVSERDTRTPGRCLRICDRLAPPIQMCGPLGNAKVGRLH